MSKLVRIHVNQHVIKSNARATGYYAPPLTVKSAGENVKAMRVFIDGPCEIVYRPERPLPCGAKVWIETRANVHTEGSA